jgi:serine/threonine protein kinase
MGSTQIPGQPMAIVMEYVKGGSLTDLLKRDISERFKCKLGLDVAKGMSFLHSHNIYHRDIKPDNMLVSKTNFRDTNYCR